jgi:hypothetical protein
MFLKKKKLIEYDEKEILHFYKQLIKMKKKRGHINPLVMLLKLYPNSKKNILEILANYKQKE